MGNCNSSDNTVRPSDNNTVRKVVRGKDEIKRAQTFQVNLKDLKDEHGAEALEAKYATGMSIGQNEPVLEAAMSGGKSRGSVQYDMSPAYKEMKTLLDDPQAQRHLGHWITGHHLHHVLFCWVDCTEYEIIPSTDYRRSKAIYIIKKYVVTSSDTDKEDKGLKEILEEDLRKYYVNMLASLEADHSMHTEKDLFFPLVNTCFRELVR